MPGCGSTERLAFDWINFYQIPAHIADRLCLNGKAWLKRSVRPYVTPGDASTHMLVSRLPAALPGYIDFAGIKEITAPDRAGMPGFQCPVCFSCNI